MADPGIKFTTSRIHIHRWPRDSPEWNEQAQKTIASINGRQSLPVVIGEDTATVGSVEFRSLKKLGVTVPFFKRECTVIFEGLFGGFAAHVHLTTAQDYIGTFNRVAAVQSDSG